MAKRFLSNVNINDQYTLPSSDGTSGQIIQTDGAGSLSFIDNAADEARKIVFTVKNKDSISLSKGTVVHASPSATPPSGNVIEVIRADNDDSSKMPAIGVLNETLAVDAEGECVMLGSVSGIATNSFAIGDELYVSNTPGEFTNTKPTGTSNLIQKIAIVIKSHSTNGLIEVFGAGRANDVPNLLTRDITIDGAHFYFGNADQIRMGDSIGLRLQHNGSHSFIDTEIGNMYFRAEANNSDMVFQADDGNGGNANYFYLDGSLATHDGTNNTARYTVWGDNSRIALGDSQDLQIYHDGSHSYVDDSGVGNLRLRGNAGVQIMKSATSEIMGEFIADGAVNLYYDNSKKFETTSSGIDVTGIVKSSGNGASFTFEDRVNSGNNWEWFSANNNAGLYKNHNTAETVMTIDSSGNVGIGTTSPGSLLHIDGSRTTAVLQANQLGTGVIANFKQNGNSKVLIDNNGNVGIGTTSPSAKLEVSSTSFNDHITLTRNTDELGISVSGGQLLFEGGVSPFNDDNEDLGRSDKHWSEIFVYSVRSGGELQFKTNGNNERMRIDSSGNVGIGETSPLVPLHISKDSASGENIALLLDNNNTTAGNEIGILFRSMAGSTNTDFEIFGKANGANDMDLVFQSDGSVERMRIDSSGVVTITRSLTPAASLSDITQLKIENTNTSFGGSAAGIQLDAGNGDTTGFILSRADGNDNTFEGVIIGTATDNPIIFCTNTGTTSITSNERMRITSDGNVGIGTTTPAHGKLVISSNQNNSNNFTWLLFDNQAAGYGDWNMFKSGNNDLAFGYGTSNGASFTNALTLKYGGNVGIGTTSPSQRAVISGLNTSPSLNTTAVSNASLLISNSDTGYGTYFASTGGGIGLIQQRRQTSAVYYDLALQPYGGNVGIGTSSPDVKLEVVEASPTDGIIADFVNSTNAGGTIAAIKLSNADSEACDVILGANRIGANFGSDFFISLSDSVDGTNQERFRITEAGNLGIGTTSPQAKLEVITTRTGTPSSDANIKVTDDTAQAADVGGSINFTGKYTDAGTYLNGSPFIRASKKNSTTGDYGYGLKFGVRATGSGTSNVAMTIDSDSDTTFSGDVTAETLTLTSGNDNLTFTQSGDDWTINNAQQNNGITIYDGATGVDINYNGSSYFEVDATGVHTAANIDFYVDTNTLYVDATNNLVGIGKNPSTYKLDVNGKIASDDYIIAGLGNGGVALTHNDGYGNANVTFNHVAGIPEQNGNSFRIECNTDSIGNPSMIFELAANVTSGVAVSTVEKMRLDETGVKVRDTAGGIIHLERDDTSIVDGNPLGRLRFTGDDPVNGTFNFGAEIRGVAAGTWSTDNYPSKLRFYTATTDLLNLALTLDSSQNATFYGNITPNTDSTYNIGTSTVRFANVYADNLYGLAQDLAVTSNDTFTGTYSLLWHSGAEVYSSSFMTINGTTDTFNVPNIDTGAIASGQITITTPAVPFIFNESGNTGDGQWWRHVLDGGNMRFDVSVTGGSGFTTYYAPLQLNSDGTVDLKYQSSTKLETVSEGIKINGRLGLNMDPGTTYQFSTQYTQTNPNDDFRFAHFIDANFSGADNTTADREQGGIYMDIDSSADGDASNEHRLYGIYIDQRFSGYSDVSTGIYSRVESNNNTEKTANIHAIHGYAVHDTSSNGGVSSLNGVKGEAAVEDDGDIDNAYGVFGRTMVVSTRAVNVDNTYGGYFEVQTDSPSAISYGSMHAVRAVIDNNEGAVPTFGNQYLYYGDYQGTKGSNAYGLYIAAEDKNYLSSSLGIGNSNPLAKLQITSGDSGASSPWSNADELILESSGNAGLAFQTPNTGAATIAFQDPESVQAGFIQYLHADNALRFATNGNNERMRIDSSGYVGIGETNPQELLHLTATTPVFRLEGGSHSYQQYVNGTIFYIRDVTNSSNRIVLDSSGNVGIGTTSPGSRRLNIVTSNSGNDVGFESTISRTSGSNYGIRGLANGSGATTNIGGFFEASGATTNRALWAYVGHVLLATQNTNDYVGIGTESPSQKLEVNGNILATGELQFNDANTKLLEGTSNTLRIQTNSGYVDIGPKNSSWCHFNTDRANFYFAQGASWNGHVKPYTSLAVNLGSSDRLWSRTYTRYIESHATQARVKFSIWSGSTYGIGMQTGYTFGAINNDYVMSFQMSNSNNRGFWWGDNGHSNAQGAMSLSTQGKLTVAHSIRLGYGESDTTVPGATYRLDVSGIIRATGDIIAFSDKRVKENIKTIDNSLEKVDQLRGVEFNKIGENKKSIGVIAQEIEEILPEVVSTDGDGMKSVAYGNITGVLIEAIKELKQEIETLKTQINK